MMKNKLQIHNSTAEFLIFQLESKEEGIEKYDIKTRLFGWPKTLSLRSSTKDVPLLRNIWKISLKAKNCKKIQFVGNSDELLRTEKITQPNITI